MNDANDNVFKVPSVELCNFDGLVTNTVDRTEIKLKSKTKAWVYTENLG